MSASIAGVLVIDKPAGMSSAAVVGRIKAVLRVERAGHAGTLDPMATGVLVVCVGEATKIATYLLLDDKRYLATARLGEATDTLDADGTVTLRASVPGVTEAEVREALAGFVGRIEQTPPAFSALKQGGQPLYRRARRGEVVAPQPRTVVINSLELVTWIPPELTFRVDCGKGTYVRSLAADIAAKLGTVAHLKALRRERSGPFLLADSAALPPPLDPTQVEVSAAAAAAADPTQVEPRPTRVEVRERLVAALIPPAAAVRGLTRVEVDGVGEAALRRGQPVEGAGEGGGPVALVGEGRQLVAIGEVRDGRIWPVRVLHPHG